MPNQNNEKPKITKLETVLQRLEFTLNFLECESQKDKQDAFSRGNWGGYIIGIRHAISIVVDEINNNTTG